MVISQNIEDIPDQNGVLLVVKEEKDMVKVEQVCLLP